jgi:glycosyltransferase involved in cell wall biosynthesis
MTDICLLVPNTFLRDGRASKQSHTLAGAGYDVTVLAVHDAAAPDRESLGPNLRVRRLRVAARRLPKGAWTQPIKGGEYFARLAAATIALRPRIVQCCGMELLAVAWAGARATGSRLLYDAREIGPEAMVYQGLPAAARRLMDHYEGAFCRRADAIIDVEPARAAYLGRRHRVPVPAIVGNYPNLIPAGSTNLLRERLGLAPSTRIILYTGVIRRDRGLLEAIAALREVADAVLVVVGYGPDTERLADARRALGVADRVFVLPAVPPGELPRMCQGADVGLITLKNVCLNNYYAAPGKLYDYLMAGLPVLVSDFPGLRTIAERGAGVAVDPENPAQIARALNRILADDALRRMMGQRARELAETEYNWDRASRVLLEVYGRLLARR